ncbi:hypothetical protein D8674_010264 [Pyrus ussuriensis x Pyrus communis]|uniref:Uncharacterized protein n=1 Tax=Pyrus ussuriensis x Pyrus communis TaxID=2448454 RepID=A0A5N5FB01_9ROSA|nr:hypothetical protein D8674_010264 [Pyrus ussuriensis x Pyrus communis]
MLPKVKHFATKKKSPQKPHAIKRRATYDNYVQIRLNLMAFAELLQKLKPKLNEKREVLAFIYKSPFGTLMKAYVKSELQMKKSDYDVIHIANYYWKKNDERTISYGMAKDDADDEMDDVHQQEEDDDERTISDVLDKGDDQTDDEDIQMTLSIFGTKIPNEQVQYDQNIAYDSAYPTAENEERNVNIIDIDVTEIDTVISNVINFHMEEIIQKEAPSTSIEESIPLVQEVAVQKEHLSTSI